MRSTLGAIWRSRFFWLSLVKMDLRTRYRRSILGIGWSLLHPIAMTTILCVVFHRIFKIDIREFGPFLLSGLACWNYLVSSTLDGCQCFFVGESYIRQYPAPLPIYPLRSTLGATIHFLLTFAVVLAFAWSTRGFGNPVALFSLTPSLILLFVLAWSLAILAGFANAVFQDTRHILEIAFQILFFATPVMYPISKLHENNLGWLIDYNPVVPFLRLIREPILEGRIPSFATFATAGLIVTAMVVAASWTAARLQRRLIFFL